jgi:hypothetical protein
MHLRLMRTLSIVFLALLLLGAAGCAGHKGSQSEGAGPAFLSAAERKRQYLFENVDGWIALAPAGVEAENNDHPVRLHAHRLRGLLSGVETRSDPSRSRGLFEDEDGRTVKLFTDTTLDKFAEPLTMAFARATERQDILLYVRQRREGAYVKFFSEQVVTTARLFHRRGRLHIIFGAVDAAPQAAASTDPRNTPKSGSYRSPAARPLHHFPVGSRGRAAALRAELRAEGGIAAAPSGREDWLVLDTRALRMHGTDASQPFALPEGKPTGENRAPFPEHVNALDHLDEATLERLRELRELRRQDLISAPVYESLVRELLDM